MRIWLFCLAALVSPLLSACTKETEGTDMPASAVTPHSSDMEINGITLRVTEAGPKNGPLVLLIHGFPELAYSWRYQIPALAEAGYHVVVPDMRGYGGSSSPANVEDFDIHHLAGDVVGLIDAFGHETASLIGHDWGAAVAWNSVLLHPERFNGLMTMSVPYRGRGPAAPTAMMERNFGENFYYMLYFQEPGVAEAEFDPDPRDILNKLYADPDTPRSAPEVTDPRASAGGWGVRFGEPLERPDWMSEDDLQVYVDAFNTSGFRGGVSYYRNLDRNWETTESLQGATISIPVRFLAGDKDVVIGGADEAALRQMMSNTALDLEKVVVVPDTGHWIQQEQSEIVNAEILEFLASLHD